MPLGEIIETLVRLRRMVALVLVASLAAAVLGGYRLSGFPPTPQPRTLPLGVATKQVLVDAPADLLTDLHTDTGPMTARVGALTQVLASPTVVQRISRITGIPADEITTEGPFDGAAFVQNVVNPSESRAMQVLAERAPYRLSFVSQPNLPVFTIHVQGPGPVEAARVADATYVALERYLRTLDAQVKVKPRHPVVLRDMGPAEAGSLHSGIGKAVIVLAFVGVLIPGLLLVLSLEVLARRRRAVDAIIRSAPTSARHPRIAGSA